MEHLQLVSHLRCIFQSHDHMNRDVDVTYKTTNLFSNEKQFIYFISDVPHLIKTARNCLPNSASNRCARYMWNDGMYLVWNHIADIFFEGRECGLHILPKQSYEHIIVNHECKISCPSIKLYSQ